MNVKYFLAGENVAYSAPSFISAYDQTGTSIFNVLKPLVYSSAPLHYK